MHHLSLLVCVIWRLITLEDCASPSRLGVAFWASKRHCGLPVNEVCEGLEVYLEDLPEWLGEVCVTLAQGEYGEDWVSWAACSGLGVRDWVSGTVCPQVWILSRPNQTYSCHSNWNWSNKSLSSASHWFHLPFPLLTVGPCEFIVWLHYLLSSLSDCLFWLAAHYLPTWSILPSCC